MGTIDFSESHVPVLEGSYKDRGHGQLRDTSRGQPRSKSRGRNFTCFHYNQESHIKRNCPKLKAECENDQSSETTSVVVMTRYENDVLLAASDRRLHWIPNSGNSYHVCGDRRLFSTYTKCDGGLVRIANDHSIFAWQMGGHFH